MKLCYLINKKTSYCAFFSFSGHVNAIDVSVRHSRKDYDKNVSEVKQFYLNDGKHSILHNGLDKIIDNLGNYLVKEASNLSE